MKKILNVLFASQKILRIGISILLGFGLCSCDFEFPAGKKISQNPDSRLLGKWFCRGESEKLMGYENYTIRKGASDDEIIVNVDDHFEFLACRINPSVPGLLQLKLERMTGEDGKLVVVPQPAYAVIATRFEGDELVIKRLKSPEKEKLKDESELAVHLAQALKSLDWSSAPVDDDMTSLWNTRRLERSSEAAEKVRKLQADLAEKARELEAVDKKLADLKDREAAPASKLEGGAWPPAGLPWPVPPIIPGAWRDVPDADSTALRARLAAEVPTIAAKINSILRFRSLELPFYTGAALVEGMVPLAQGNDTVEMATFLKLADQSIMLLDGTIGPVQRANLKGPLTLDDSTVKAYLTFFCGMLYTDHGNFRLVSGQQDLVFNSGKDARESKLGPTLFLPAAMRRTKDKGWEAEVTMQYQSALFVAAMGVTPDGGVTMMEEKAITAVQPFVTDRFSGNFRVVSSTAAAGLGKEDIMKEMEALAKRKAEIDGKIALNQEKETKLRQSQAVRKQGRDFDAELESIQEEIDREKEKKKALEEKLVRDKEVIADLNRNKEEVDRKIEEVDAKRKALDEKIRADERKLREDEDKLMEDILKMLEERE